MSKKLAKNKDTEEVKDMLQIFDNMRRIVNAHGVSKSNKILQAAIKDEEGTSRQTLIINAIVAMVIKDCSIKMKRTDLNKRNLRGDMVEVRNISFVAIARCLCINPHDIRKNFKPISYNTVWKAINEYTKLDKDNFIDKKKIEKVEKICEKVTQLIINKP